MSDFGEVIPIISTINDRQNSTDKLSPEVKLVEYTADSTLAKADILNDGDSEQLKEWKLIIMYTGELEELAKRYDIQALDLGYGYALIDIKPDILARLEKDKNVIYVDKSKRLYIST